MKAGKLRIFYIAKYLIGKVSLVGNHFADIFSSGLSFQSKQQGILLKKKKKSRILSLEYRAHEY